MTRRSKMAALTGLGALLAARAGLRRVRAFPLRGKVVVITGGSRGLGLELAREFAARGSRLALCARDGAELERAKDELTGLGAQVRTYRCDVSEQRQVNELVESVTAELGPVDVLVNNAGIIQVGPFENMTVADFEEAMRVHFFGPLYTVLAVAPSMKARRSGRIVNISSIGGKVSVPHLLPYSASKFALTGFSEGLRSELAKSGVKVTTVCPGLMRTGSPRNATVKGNIGPEYAWFALGGALPFTSMGSRRAARQIVKACREGIAEIVLSPQARVLTALTGLFAGFVSDVLGLVNRILPDGEGLGTGAVRGHHAESPLTSSRLTALSWRAAVRNNEVS